MSKHKEKIAVEMQEKKSGKEESQKDEAYPYHPFQRTQTRALAVLLICIAVGQCLYLYFVYKKGSAWEKQVGWSVVMSRMSALILIQMFDTLLFCMCRRLHMEIPFWLSNFLPLDYFTKLHKFFGIVILIAISTHVGGHCKTANTWGKADKSLFVDPVFNNLKDATHGTELGYHTSVDGITGWIMVLLFFSVAVTSLARRKFFNCFEWTHYSVYPIIILLYLHSLDEIFNRQYQIVRWFHTPFAVLYLLDCLMRFTVSWQPVYMVEARVITKTLVRLRLAKAKYYKYVPGQFTKVYCHKLGRQFHAFTMTSLDHEPFVEVYIARAGDWTGRLIDFASDPKKKLELRRAKWRMNGPYIAPAVQADMYDIQIFIGLGIGVTPFFSVLRSYLHKVRANPDLNKHVLGVFSCRNPVWLTVLGELLARFKTDFETQDNLTLDRMKAGESDDDDPPVSGVPPLLKQPSEAVINLVANGQEMNMSSTEDCSFSASLGKRKEELKEGETRPASSSLLQSYANRASHLKLEFFYTGPKEEFKGLAVKTTRPDFNKLFSQHKRDCRTMGHKHPQKVGVFYCGPQNVAEAVMETAKQQNTYLFRYKCHIEEFG